MTSRKPPGKAIGRAKILGLTMTATAACLAVTATSASAINSGLDVTEERRVGQFSSVVGVETNQKEGFGVCGGVYIGAFTVLTAAHCVTKDGGESRTSLQPSDVQIRAKSLKYGVGGIVAPVGEVHVHPDYAPGATDLDGVSAPPAFDVAILKLTSELPGVTPAQVPSTPPTENDLKQPAYVAGWGNNEKGEAPDVMQFVDLKVIENSKCAELFERDKSDFGPSVLCAGPVNSADIQGVNKGDSGGPLLLGKPGGVQQVIGIASFARKGLKAGQPSGFARTSTIASWIANSHKTLAFGGTPTVATSTLGGTYVADTSGTVSVVNESNNIIREVHFGGSLSAISTSPDGQRIYVADAQSGDLLVLNSELAEIARVSVGAANALSVSPDGKIIYVANEGDDTLIAIETGSNKVVSKVKAESPSSVTSTNELIYSVGTGQDFVAVRDPVSLQVLQEIPVNSARAVKASSDAKYLYVAGGFGSDGKISVIDTSTLQQVTTWSVPGTPQEISLDPQGKYAYISTSRNTVSMAEISTGHVTSITVGTLPGSIDITPNGKSIFVANRLSHSVSVLAPTWRE